MVILRDCVFWHKRHHGSCFLWLLVLALIAKGGAAFAQVNIDFSYLKISENQEAQPQTIEGQIKISGWSSPNGFCLYLPYNDPQYGQKRLFARRFESSAQYQKNRFQGGKIDLVGMYPLDNDVQKLTDYLVFINPAAGGNLLNEINLEFKATVPRLVSSSDQIWFYDLFYPVPLSQCPKDILDSSYYSLYSRNNITANLEIPKGWSFAGPESDFSEVDKMALRWQGNHLAFALTKVHKLEVIKINDINIRLFYFSENFRDIIPTIESALLSHTNWLGDFPFPSLTIIETSELERVDIQGMVLINTPHQSLFKSLQKNWLNWSDWVMTYLLATQWLGASVQVESQDDWWLLAGLADFVTEESLNSEPLKSKKTFFKNNSKLDFITTDYKEMNDILSATLKRRSPKEFLVNKDLTSRPLKKQSPLNYLKHVAALHQIKNIGGSEKFSKFLKAFTRRHQTSFVRPKDFIQQFFLEPVIYEPKDMNFLSEHTVDWWESKTWPDLSLNQFSSIQTKDGHWLTRCEVGFNTTFQVPFMLRIEGMTGERSDFFFEEPSWDRRDKVLIEVTTDFQPKEAIIDPDYYFYDSNRFNNSKKLPNFYFLPGNFKHLSDQNYSVIWLPYAFRRPGEPFSLSVEAATFKFIDHVFASKVDFAPSEDVIAWEFMINRKYPHLNFNTITSASRDFYGLTRYTVGVESPLINADAYDLSLDTKINHLVILGKTSLSHETFELGLRLTPALGEQMCKIPVVFGSEQSFSMLPQDFRYQKARLSAMLACSFSPYLDTALRGFWGKINFAGELPTNIAFNVENLEEARVRLDAPRDYLANDITSLGFDLFFPFNFALPMNTPILTRMLKWRAYYDQGLSTSPINRRFSAAGGGLLLPIGGQLSGVNPISITQLSLLAVLYKKINEEESRQISVIFDFAADL